MNVNSTVPSALINVPANLDILAFAIAATIGSYDIPIKPVQRTVAIVITAAYERELMSCIDVKITCKKTINETRKNGEN